MQPTRPMPAAAGSSSPSLHHVRVSRRLRISEGFVRVTFTGPTLDRFADPGLDQRIKLVLAAPGTALSGLPFDVDWFRSWRALPDGERPIVRTYTTRAVRPSAYEVDVDFVLHEPCGPAGRFAGECRAGDEAALVGPAVGAERSGGGIDFRMPSTARRVLVAGDETAVPAIARIVAALPRRVAGDVLVEVPFASDAAQLPEHPGVSTRVLVRGDGPAGSLLPAATRAVSERVLEAAPGAEPDDVDVDRDLLWEVPDPADGAFYAWLAGEAGAIRTMRRMLVADLGVDRGSVAFMGYWRTGRPESA